MAKSNVSQSTVDSTVNLGYQAPAIKAPPKPAPVVAVKTPPKPAPAPVMTPVPVPVSTPPQRKIPHAKQEVKSRKLTSRICIDRLVKDSWEEFFYDSLMEDLADEEGTLPDGSGYWLFDLFDEDRDCFDELRGKTRVTVVSPKVGDILTFTAE